MANKLYTAALKAQKNAYAPYSKFMVGASILANNGKIYSGCNVENASYGATVCAERNAIAAMIADGATEIKEVLVVTKKSWLPCGLCRQVLMEFTKNPSKLKVTVANEKSTGKQYFLSNLLPNAFERKNLK